jgi:hypothetical protein
MLLGSGGRYIDGIVVADTVRGMGRTQRYMAQRWAREKRSASLPPWSQLVGIIAVTLVVVLLVYSAIFPHHNPAADTTGTLPPAVTTPSSVTSTTAAGFVNSGGVSVPESGGGSVEVNASALSLAKTVTEAFYSGHWAGIQEATGFLPPAGDGTHAVIHSFSVNGPGTAGLEFSFEVSPHAGAPVQTLEVVVESSNGTTWFVSYVAAI